MVSPVPWSDQLSTDEIEFAEKLSILFNIMVANNDACFFNLNL